MEAGDTQKHLAPCKRNNFSIISFLFFFLLVISLVLVSIFWSDQKRIKSYEVLGLNFYSHKYIDSLVAKAISNNCDLTEVRKEIEKFNFVKFCKIYRKDSESITIEIVEREPLLLVSDGNENIRLITTDLVVVSPKFLNSLDYPSLKVCTFSEEDFFEKYQNLLWFFQNLKQCYPEIYKNIQEISCEVPNLCLKTKSTNTKVIFPYDADLKHFSIFNEIIHCKNFARLLRKEIDLRYSGLVVIR